MAVKFELFQHRFEIDVLPGAQFFHEIEALLNGFVIGIEQEVIVKKFVKTLQETVHLIIHGALAIFAVLMLLIAACFRIYYIFVALHANDIFIKTAKNELVVF